MTAGTRPRVPRPRQTGAGDRDGLRTADFDYPLPLAQIAQRPPAERDAARMLVLDPSLTTFTDTWVRELPRFLRPGDLLVFNDTRVLPARLRGRREGGHPAEVLLLRPAPQTQVWEALVRPSRRLPPGSIVTFNHSALTATILDSLATGTHRVRLDAPSDPIEEVRRVGEMPTPPYIKERMREGDRYQTVFARTEGSAAAPTAGLHFTPELLNAIAQAGAATAFVTLHVGLDTFRPVRVLNPQRHPVHREAYVLTAETAGAVEAARRARGRVVAVGTTTVRVLETCVQGNLVRPQSGWTDLFILPGFRFAVVDALLTNFHLPRSTLLMLVSAFAGRGRVLRAYAEAVRLGYRFYSFGDCMFISARALRESPRGV